LQPKKYRRASVYFTGFKGSIIIENSFKSAEAIYVVDDAAAYALKIDNNSFINAGANSGSIEQGAFK